MTKFFGLFALFIMIGSNAFANTMTIDTGVEFTENFSQACAAKIAEIQLKAAPGRVAVTKNEVFYKTYSHIIPNCMDDRSCGATISGATCRAELSSGNRGTLSIVTEKMKSSTCSVSLSNLANAHTIFQNAYLSGRTCVIDTVNLK